IENLDWLAFINRYDKTGTLFYIDPPYWGNENDYGKGMFSRDQFELMATRLARIKGRFLLSLNDRPEVREVFKGFQFEEVKLTYSVAGGKGKAAREVIISG
ncbi:MAG: DNA adenine methylase, partial [bacterium]|nr:DNA adenine methylase [bacterium]